MEQTGHGSEDCFEVFLLGRNRKSDVNMQPAVLGCVSEVRHSWLESRKVLANLFDGGVTVREDSGHKFDRVSVPSRGHARLLERVAYISRWLRLGQSFQSLYQASSVCTDKAPLVRKVPVRKVGVFVV